MDIISWLPTLTAPMLLAATLWFGRNLILTRLTKSVEHEFNTKLETLRTQMRESEARLQADLRAKEAEIAALRNGALATLASRQIALDKRRLEAVDQLWDSVIALAPARNIAHIMSRINFEKAISKIESSPKMRAFFEAFPVEGANKMDLSGAAKARPFLTPMVWGIYSTIQAIMMHGVIRWSTLKGGIGHDFADNNGVEKLLKAALPNYSKVVNEYGPSSYYHALEELDKLLLMEIQMMLSGIEADKVSITQASELIRLSEEMSKKNSLPLEL